MPKYVIEREIPGVGGSPAEALQAVSQTSCNVLSELGPQIQWLESFGTDDKIYCIYIAPSEELILEHARIAGFPANSVTKISAIIEPATAE